MRERLARLQTAERPAAAGDFVVVDYVGSLASSSRRRSDPRRPTHPSLGAVRRRRGTRPARGARRGQPDPRLRGGSARSCGWRDTRRCRCGFPMTTATRRSPDSERHSRSPSRRSSSRSCHQSTTDFAIDAGFDDLRRAAGGHPPPTDRRRTGADRGRVPSGGARRSRRWREVGLTPELVKARAREMWERMLHSLSHRGISREAYLQIVGRQEAEILTEMEPEAELALRREAVITAIVAAESIDPVEEELLQALAPTAEREGIEPQKLLERAAQCGTPGGGARGSRRTPGDRPGRWRRQADPAGAGAGARAAVDARQGARGTEGGCWQRRFRGSTCTIVDARSLAF